METDISGTHEALAAAVRMAAAGPRERGEGLCCPIVRLDTSPALAAWSAAPDRIRRLTDHGVAVLDAVTDPTPAAVAAATRRHRDAGGELPLVLPLAGVGLLIAADSGQTVYRVAHMMAATSISADAAAMGSGRLTGCAALVTGAGQGFGQGIAFELARDGAVVTVADVNRAGAMETASAIEAAFGKGCAQAVQMDVTDLGSVRQAARAAMAAFGGIDLLVANAGVLKAGGIDELDTDAFDLVTRVNYTGYFTCVKAVAPWMRFQHTLAPGHFMDIIQINSKSGLEGSKRNFAYAGSKFGALGLTQSFALELIADNIKVNAVCPGNYFDGPLWSDPERGLFVQYLKAGKVPGARSIAEVRDFYMAKIPRGRGCTPSDVAVTIRYLIEQTYETGQAIPVTGGQVMLK